METNAQNPLNPNPNPLFQPNNNNNKKKSNNWIWIGLLGAALLGSNLFWMNKSGDQEKTITQTTADLSEETKLKAELELKYNESLNQLEEMRSSNTELNKVIDAQKAELIAQKKKIDQMIATKRDLSGARAEIDKLKAQVQGYLSEISQLKNDKQALSQRVDQISQEKVQLEQTVTTVTAAKEGLEKEKATLVSEKETLTKTNEGLSKKVNVGSVVQVKDVEITTARLKDSGKEVKRSKAKNIEVINICFTATANQVTDPGSETFFIKILNPLGETLSVESSGGGIIKDNSNGEQVRYTTTAQIDSYKNADEKVCTKWNVENISLQKGNYEVVIYNKGYVCGKGTLKMR